VAGQLTKRTAEDGGEPAEGGDEAWTPTENPATASKWRFGRTRGGNGADENRTPKGCSPSHLPGRLHVSCRSSTKPYPENLFRIVISDRSNESQ